MMKFVQVLLFLIIQQSYSQVVSTFAGSTNGFQDGLAAVAKFGEPNGICSDGNFFYVADTGNARIRKINKITSEVTTLAGSTFGANNGFGSAAQFNGPVGICIDNNNSNLYVVDMGNFRIRKINISTTEVTTIAGSNFGFNNGIGNLAQFGIPLGIAFLNGNLYVTDFSNNNIRKINLTNNQVTTVTGSTEGDETGSLINAKFSKPFAVTADSFGNLFVSDTFNNKIKKIDLVNNLVTVVAGSTRGDVDGSTTTCEFNHPRGLCFDLMGNLYVTDNNNSKIKRINFSSNQVITIAGSIAGFLDGTGLNAQFNAPVDICLDNNDLFVSDAVNYKIRKISSVLNTSTFNFKNNFKYYPNPISNELNIKLKNTNGQIILTDIYGKIIVNQRVENIYTKINTSSLSTGIYFLTVNTENSISTEKIIKE